MNQSSTRNKRLHPIIALILTTTAVIIWALFVRWSDVGYPFFVETWDEITWLEPYFVGFAIQELVVAIGLVYLFSRVQLFRRVIAGPRLKQDEMALLAVLVGIQLVVFLYRFGLIRAVEEQVTIGLFIVIVAGLLGGWRVGLGVGVFTMLAIGWTDYVRWLDPGETFQLPVYFESYILRHMDGTTAVWAGTAAGLASAIWPKWRFRLDFGAGLTAVIVTIVFILNAYSSDYPPQYIERWLPNLLVLALATAVFSLIIRSIQDEEIRHQAKTAQLELTQTNLALTQTRLALAQAELRALHAQINPHFFFNTLNTIRYFIRTDPDTARDLLIKLSEIFQRALSAGEFTPLRDEITYVEAYLALEKARLDERLQIIWTNLAKDHLDQSVPTLVLQPIVENAVIHGISAQPEGGTLHIVINRVGTDLLVQVADDGAGFDVNTLMVEADAPEETAESAEAAASAAVVRQSIGIRNVDERLRMLYGDDYRLQIESEAGNGTRVVFKIPLNDE